MRCRLCVGGADYRAVIDVTEQLGGHGGQRSHAVDPSGGYPKRKFVAPHVAHVLRDGCDLPLSGDFPIHPPPPPPRESAPLAVRPRVFEEEQT
jgi:hypothetical protein